MDRAILEAVARADMIMSFVFLGFIGVAVIEIIAALICVVLRWEEERYE